MPFAQMRSFFAQIGTLFAQNHGPYPFSLLSCDTPLSEIGKYTTHTTLYPKTPHSKNSPHRKNHEVCTQPLALSVLSQQTHTAIFTLQHSLK